MQLEPDPGSIFIIWARAGALPTPLEPSKSTKIPLWDALAGLLLSWWHRALRRDASAARVGGSCAAVTAPATTMTVRGLRLRTAEPSGRAQKLRGVCL